MKTSDFLNSKWVDMARAKGAEKKVRKQFHRWVDEVKDTKLVKQAKRLWDHLNSGDVSTTEKVVIVAALLYLISPLDLVPDAVPVLGFLDDLGVAGFALNYLMDRADKMGGKGKKSGKSKKSKGKSPQAKLIKAVRKAVGA